MCVGEGGFPSCPGASGGSPALSVTEVAALDLRDLAFPESRGPACPRFFGRRGSSAAPVLSAVGEGARSWLVSADPSPRWS